MTRDPKRLLLLLLKTATKKKVSLSIAQIQKIMFLLVKEKGIDIGLEFKPFIFGPFSEELQNMVYDLVEEGFATFTEKKVRDPLSGEIIARPKYYRLKRGVKVEPTDDEKEIVEFFQYWAEKPQNELLKYVHEKFPEYSKYELVRKHLLSILLKE